MPTLALTDFNIFCASIGGFISLFGLVSYLVKERFYLSEALISLLAGVTFSPHALDWIRPLQYAQNDPVNIEYITLYFSRLVLGVQLVLAGIQLPSRYLRTEWRSMSILLGPGMTIMWLISALLVWAMVPNLPFLHALAVGACVTPTDPILSNTIVKGKFADKNIPKPLQEIIIAESGANDGLGYPFLFLALYLIKYDGHNGVAGAGEAIRLWFAETWAYEILLSVAYGVVVGWIAKDLLHFAEKRKYVDRESFLIFAITLALFIVGTCGMIGTDDVLACFIAGNVFTWDDWFRVETQDDSLQPTIDMLLNIVIFAWYGAVIPWPDFRTNDIIPIYRLIFLGVLILLCRRPPMIFAFQKFIRQVRGVKEMVYMGYFGPIGVSAVFYLFVSREFLLQIEVDGQPRDDCLRLARVIELVVWFLVTCSIVVHGLTVSVGKFGYHFPRQLSQAISTEKREGSDTRPAGIVQRLFAPLKRRRQNRSALPVTDRTPPQPFQLGQPRPYRNSVSSYTADATVEESSNREPPRPVIIIDTPVARSPAMSPSRKSHSTLTPTSTNEDNVQNGEDNVQTQEK